MEKTTKGRKIAGKKPIKASEKSSIPFNFKVSHPVDDGFMAKRIGIAMALYKPEKGITNPVKPVGEKEMVFGDAQAEHLKSKARTFK